jgi:hypothetical protein
MNPEKAGPKLSKLVNHVISIFSGGSRNLERGRGSSPAKSATDCGIAFHIILGTQTILIILNF